MKAAKCINVHAKTLRDYLRSFLEDMHQVSLLCKRVTKGRSEQPISQGMESSRPVEGTHESTLRVTLKGAVNINKKSQEPD